MESFWAELKRRRVIRIAGVYAMIAWGLIEVADTVFPALQLPDWTISFVIVVLILGFPVALLLSWVFQVTPDGVIADTGAHNSPVASSQDNRLIYLILFLLLVLAAFQIADQFSVVPEVAVESKNPISRTQIIRSTLDLGLSVEQPILGLHHEFAFSPDGNRLAFTMLDESGASIDVRSLVDGTTTTVVEDGGPFTPKFSPDGSQILYANISTSALHVIPSSGGRSRVITEAANLAMGANWLDGQTLVYSNALDGMLTTISVIGGEPQAMDIPASPGERQSWPSLSADGNWLLYSVTSEPLFYEGRVDAYELSTGVVKNLISRGYNANMAGPNHILFMRDEGLWAAACSPSVNDECDLETRLEDEVAHHPVLGVASYAVSNNGLLLFHNKEAFDAGEENLTRTNELVWQTIAGEDIPHSLPMNTYVSAWSPMGTHLAFNLRNSDGGRDVGIYDVERRTIQRRTFTSEARSGIWSPDGSLLVYTVNNGNGSDLWMTNADGSGQPERIASGATPLRPNSFSPDNSKLVITEGIPDVRRLKVLDFENTEIQLANLLDDESIQTEGIISPDGRWIAYASMELGEFEIFVRPFPNIEDGKWQVTYGGGMDPMWTQDSSQLFYLNMEDDAIYRVDVNAEIVFSVGAPEKLTEEISWSLLNQRHFTISPDGDQLIYIQTFNPLIIRPSSLILVSGMFERLGQIGREAQ